MKIIKTIQRNILVSDEDFNLIKKYDWEISHYEYPSTRINGNTVPMHRLIINCPKNMVVDHINGNKLDNRRENLRICTEIENMRNKKLYGTNKSGFMGVYKSRNKWTAQITINYKNIFLGRFDTAIDAARSRDEAVKKQYGGFGRLNFPN